MDGQRGLNADLDAALARLRERAAVWATLPIAEKIALLRACRDRVARSAERWAWIAADIKGVGGMEAAGEEALSGPWGTMRALDAYIRTLRRLDKGRPRMAEDRVRRRKGGGTAVRVFPNTLFDRALLPGVSADVWFEPDAGLGDSSVSRGRRPGSVVAVMGAGNVTSIGVLDVLSKLVNDGAVCVLKVHPLLGPLLPVFDDIFAPLVDKGFVAITCGDAGVGAHLCGHPHIDAVHVTGSTATYRAIAVETAKPLTAELGNVTPAIVMGGRWSDREIEVRRRIGRFGKTSQQRL
jgi:acyl-CoA reductase-like NAD-dependent aldehyde dehydrogenase